MKNTVIRSILALVMAFMALPMMGQDYMFIYFKNGDFRKFYMKNITEITTSQFDANGIQHSGIDFQHITTVYDRYVYNLEDVDSITFTKIDEELAEHNFVTAMPMVFSALSTCNTIKDVENKLDIIKNTEGVADAWSDGHQLYVAIAEDEVYSFHFEHKADFDIGSLVEQINALKTRFASVAEPDGTQLKAVIANQQHNDADRNYYIDEYYIPLKNTFSSLGIAADYVASPTIDFFYDNCHNPDDADHLNIYDYDIVFLVTHGFYDENGESICHLNEYWLLPDEIVSYNVKGHGICSSEEFFMVESASEDADDQPGAWVDYYKILKNWRNNSSYANATDLHINIDFCHEQRGNQWYWVAHPTLTEFFFKDIAQGHFSNPNSVFFNSACQSLKGDNNTFSDSFAEKFFDLGLGTYMGYTESDNFGKVCAPELFTNMLKFNWSLEKAYQALPKYYKEETVDNIKAEGYILTPEEESDLLEDLEGAQLRFVYNPENSSMSSALFILPPHTDNIDVEKANQEYNKTNTVTVNGEATLLDFDENVLKAGFAVTYHDPVGHTQYVEAEVDPICYENNVYKFSAKLENIERERTYSVCAYINDGLNYNIGNFCSFKIDKIIELQLSTNSLSLEAGWTRTVDITSGSGSYLVESSDEHIATAFVDGNTISVNALTPGDAKITVYDKITGLEAAIMVTVTGQTDTRELMITKTVNKTVYSIYKRILDENDYRTNPDGWNCYRSELVLDIIKDGNTESYVIDDNIYLDKQGNHHSGQQPCMLLDFNKNMIGVFCNSKGYGYNYQMDGYYYYTSMDGISFTKETVFDGANWGWFPYFRDYGDDNVYLCNFSYGGYFTILAVRENGSWDLYYDNQDISAEAAQQIWERIGSVLVIGDTPDDEVDDRIHTVIPEEIRDVIDEYIPIYDGMNPPNIEGSYYLNPQILIGSSLSYDQVGTEYAPEYQKYGNQDMVNNTIDMVRVQGRDYTIEWDKGSGAFISGTGNNFTIYFDMEGESYGIMTKMVYIVSGTKTDTGIKNLTAGFILKEKGDDPEGTLVPVGTFRFFTDQDGMCETTTWPYGDIYGSKKHVKNGLDLPGILERGKTHLTPVK